MDYQFSQRDRGDECDFDVVGSASKFDSGSIQIDPVVNLRDDQRVIDAVKVGIARGEFCVRDDGSIDPVVPPAGEVNFSWSRLLARELLLATGRDPNDSKAVDSIIASVAI